MFYWFWVWTRKVEGEQQKKTDFLRQLCRSKIESSHAPVKELHAITREKKSRFVFWSFEEWKNNKAPINLDVGFCKLWSARAYPGGGWKGSMTWPPSRYLGATDRQSFLMHPCGSWFGFFSAVLFFELCCSQLSHSVRLSHKVQF